MTTSFKNKENRLQTRTHWGSLKESTEMSFKAANNSTLDNPFLFKTPLRQQDNNANVRFTTNNNNKGIKLFTTTTRPKTPIDKIKFQRVAIEDQDMKTNTKGGNGRGADERSLVVKRDDTTINNNSTDKSTPGSSTRRRSKKRSPIKKVKFGDDLIVGPPCDMDQEQVINYEDMEIEYMPVKMEEIEEIPLDYEPISLDWFSNIKRIDIDPDINADYIEARDLSLKSDNGFFELEPLNTSSDEEFNNQRRPIAKCKSNIQLKSKPSIRAFDFSFPKPPRSFSTSTRLNNRPSKVFSLDLPKQRFNNNNYQLQSSLSNSRRSSIDDSNSKRFMTETLSSKAKKSMVHYHDTKINISADRYSTSRVSSPRFRHSFRLNDDKSSFPNSGDVGLTSDELNDLLI